MQISELPETSVGSKGELPIPYIRAMTGPMTPVVKNADAIELTQLAVSFKRSFKATLFIAFARELLPDATANQTRCGLVNARIKRMESITPTIARMRGNHFRVHWGNQVQQAKMRLCCLPFETLQKRKRLRHKSEPHSW
jgi:hypothetical protein